ncbi:Zn-ribbon domain-containing OB-fold protein [Minwuia thermotolerans]|uniref:Zn-ribbon domain-containing OB-fold protein n=1 Tax=Minwuia thermotolerans TaxID=2056226 RepID=UPI000D6DC3B4|nr:zinc ribbon domain-containing protein [Minwuia thermotolerans]
MTTEVQADGRNLPPLPTPFEWDQGFWDAAKAHKLVVQRCSDCKKVRHFPRLMCPDCRSMEFEWVETIGRGRIYAWSTLYKAFHPGFTDLPMTVLIVALDDYPQVHLVGRLMNENVTEADLAVDKPVEVVFNDVTQEITLPEFRLVEA